MNQVVFSGRVAADPVLRYDRNGGSVVNFTLLQSIGDRLTRLQCVMFRNAEMTNADAETAKARALLAEVAAENGEEPDFSKHTLSRVGYIMDAVRVGHSLTVSGRVQNNDYSTQTNGVQTRTFGVECVVLDFDHNTTRAEAERILAAQQARAEQKAEATAVAEVEHEPAFA